MVFENHDYRVFKLLNFFNKKVIRNWYVIVRSFLLV